MGKDIITCEEVIQFIRDQQRISEKESISADSLLEDDLGITGDDGVELLEEAEKHFKVTLSTEEDGFRKTFGLAENEYLFHSEGFDLILGLLNIFGINKENVKKLTVGDLYQVILWQKNKS